MYVTHGEYEDRPDVFLIHFKDFDERNSMEELLNHLRDEFFRDEDSSDFDEIIDILSYGVKYQSAGNDRKDEFVSSMTADEFIAFARLIWKNMAAACTVIDSYLDRDMPERPLKNMDPKPRMVKSHENGKPGDGNHARKYRMRKGPEEYTKNEKWLEDACNLTLTANDVMRRQEQTIRLQQDEIEQLEFENEKYFSEILDEEQ